MPFPGHAAAQARTTGAATGTARSGLHRNWPWDQGPSINWALSGQASADSAQSGDPASNAIDGDAGTEWCPNAWEGTLTVDLRQTRSLDGLGITLEPPDAPMAPGRQAGRPHRACWPGGATPWNPRWPQCSRDSAAGALGPAGWGERFPST